LHFGYRNTQEIC